MNDTFLSPEYLTQKKLQEEGNLAKLYEEGWKLSISTILLLLFALLCLRVAMSRISSRGLAEALSVYPGWENSSSNALEKKDLWQTPFSSRNERALALYAGLAANFGEPRRKGQNGEDRFYGSDLVVRAGDGFLNLSLLPSAFPGGIDELSRSTQDTIGLIGRTFENSAFEISIESMSILPETARGLFNSDVELSTARAMAVLRQFLDAGVDAQRLRVGSYGSSKRGIRGDRTLRWLPLERVDIVISLRK